MKEISTLLSHGMGQFPWGSHSRGQLTITKNDKLSIGIVSIFNQERWYCIMNDWRTFRHWQSMMKDKICG